MIEVWEFRRHRLAIVAAILCMLHQNLRSCWSLNDEGLALLRFRERLDNDPFGSLSDWIDDIGVINPCSWFGVECSEGNVVALNLKNLCLVGTLAPELGKLMHLKSIILRNNSFYGVIPEDIGEMEELEVLDLGHNNFRGPLPSTLGNNLSLGIILLDNNELLGSMLPELHNLKMLSEIQVEEDGLLTATKKVSCGQRSILWNIVKTENSARRIILQIDGGNPNIPAVDPPPFPSPLPSPDVLPTPTPTPSPSPSPSPSPAPDHNFNVPAPKSDSSPPSLSAPLPSPAKNSPKNPQALILSVVIGGSVLLLVSVIGMIFCRGNKVAAVRPWATGLSGQLQKAFVTGVPKLKRLELEAACEDFSNVISSSRIGTVYKGILSNGVEIAVISVAVSSAKDWSNNWEAQFRNKIDTLSKVNHKNFVNLVGYCEEEEPFTRMLVFEYAPNGTLFEHLHIKEAEHLDWGMRMRIAMGMAYCLEHMLQLTPPIAHKTLNASVVNLTEDYAAKISDFGFWNQTPSVEMESSPECNVYSFGVILFEMVTGRMPYSVDSRCSLEDWASDYLREKEPLLEMVDPTLKSFQVDQVKEIGELIRYCVHPDPKLRPLMGEVTARLRQITGIAPDGAVPKLSPLWWAELEILSTEAV